jgi:hypothetical protein
MPLPVITSPQRNMRMGSVWFMSIVHCSSFIVHLSLSDLRHSTMTNDK